MSTPRRDSFLGAVSTIAAVTLASRVVGFVRWLVFSSEVGGTCVGQAYATANQVPNVLYEVAAGGALAAIVVPLVANALERGDRRGADHLSSALLSWAVLILLPLGVLVAVLAGPIARAMTGPAPADCAAVPQMTAAMLVVFAPQVLLYGVGIVLAGILQAHRRFLAAAVAPLLSSAVVIAAYVGYGFISQDHAWGGAQKWMLAGGTTLGVVMLSLPLVFPVWRAGVRLRPTLRMPPGTARRAIALASAGMLALIAQQIAVLVTINLANRRGEVGAVNVYNYVQAVYLLPYALLAVPIATAVFPRLAGAAGDEALARVLPLVGAAGALGSGVLVAVAQPVGDFFSHLDKHPQAMDAMTPAMLAYAPGLFGFSLIAVLSRALYVRGRAITAGLAVASGWLLAAVLPTVLSAGGSKDSSRILVLLGIGSSVGMVAGAAALAILVRGHWPNAQVGRAMTSWAKAAVAGVLGASAGAATSWMLRGVSDSLVGSAAVAVGAAVIAVAVFGMIICVMDRSMVGAWSQTMRRGGRA